MDEDKKSLQGHPDRQDVPRKEFEAKIKVKDMTTYLKVNAEIFADQYFEAYDKKSQEEEWEMGYFLRTYLEWVLLEVRAFSGDDQ